MENKTAIDTSNDRYEVRRYFDDHYERTVGSDLTLGEAKELAEKLNKELRYYVNHSIHKIHNTQKR
jgi:hypothetical protein